MLYVFGFERIGVLVSDLYFVDPNPHPGQEGAEHGVRLEVRMLGHGEPHGSIYSARTIEAGLCGALTCSSPSTGSREASTGRITTLR